MTPEQEALVQEYANAFRQEFTTKANAPKTRAEQRENIHEELDEVVPDALATLKTIIKHSKSESLRYRASTWLIEKKLESDKAENDPLNKLLQEMQKELPTAKASE